MALLPLLFVLVQSLIQYPRPAGDGLDEATHRRMQERQEMLDREMARLLKELEQGPPQQQDECWGAVLFGVLQQWPFWALTGVLLLLGLWFSCRRRSQEASSSGKEQSSCKTLADVTGKEWEEDTADPMEGGDNIDISVDGDKSSSEHDREGNPVTANDGDEDDAMEGNNDVKVKEDSDGKSVSGNDLKTDEGWSNENVPGEETAEGNEDTPGNVIENAEDLDESNEGGNKDVQVEQDKDAGKGDEGDGNEGKSRDANIKAANHDDVNVDEHGHVAGNKDGLDEANAGGNQDGQEEQDKDTGKEEEGYENEEKSCDANRKVANNGDINEDEHGNVAGNMDGLDEANAGGNRDGEEEQDKDTGKEEGDGNVGKSCDASIKAANNDDINEDEYGSVTGSMDGLDEANAGGNQDGQEEQDKDDGKEEEGDGNEGKSCDTNIKAAKNDGINADEHGHVAGNMDGLDEANAGGNKDGQEGHDKDGGKEEEDGNEGKSCDASIKVANNDDRNEDEHGSVAGNMDGLDEANAEGDKEGQEEQDKDCGKEEERDEYEEKSCDASVTTAKNDDINEDEHGHVAGNMDGLDEANERGNDGQDEQDKDAGKEEGDGNVEKSYVANIKTGNCDDVSEGEHHIDAKEEYTDVKVQESSQASVQRNSLCTGQEEISYPGNEVGNSGLAAAEEGNMEVIKEVDNDRNKDEEQGDVNVEGNKNEERKEEQQGNVAASVKEGSEGGKEESSNGRIGNREDTRDVGKKEGILLVDHIQWPGEELQRGCSVTAELMQSLTRVFVASVSNTFYPVPEEAIGVGSAFEGWSPRDWDGVYRVLVPLNPPPGHAFHLELDSAGQMAARTFSVRVELVCTCKREQLGEELLCFLHHSQKELRQKHKHSLLETLCTGSYLDVEKTSRWFSQLVRSSWLHVPQCYSWHLVFQPCRRSCRFQLSRGKKSLMVEMLFGLRQGDSDIFVSSQPTEANVPASTAWPETYAVAEVKFLGHMARQVPVENLHLKCLQVFTCILRGTGFSSSTWKTVLMHVLTTVPLSRWSRREFARRLWDIMAYLRRCLRSKRLEHFVLGNQRLPAAIRLPAAMQRLEPLNLFQHLARDPAAHREAMRAYGQLRFRLWMLLSSH